MFKWHMGYAISVVGVDSDGNIANMLFTLKNKVEEDAKAEASRNFLRQSPGHKIITILVASLNFEWR